MTGDDDKVIRGYSPEVMRRLLGYLKPYKLVSVATLAVLALATVAELLSPIVMRRALDDHVLKRYYQLPVSRVIQASQGETIPNLSRELAENMLASGIPIAGKLYVSPESFSDLSEKAMDEARDSGWLDPQEWYLFKNPSTEARNIIHSHPGLFEISGTETDEQWYAISFGNRKMLGAGEIRVIRADDISGLQNRAWQYLGLLVTILVFTFAQVYLASWVGQHIMADIRGGLLSHIMRQSLRYLGTTPVGSLVSRTANDVETINEFFTNVTISFLKDIAIMAGVIAVLFALDVQLAIVTTATLLPTFFLIIVFRNRMRESFRQVRARVSSVNAYLSERLGGMITLQLFGAEKRSAREFDEKGNNLLRAELGQMQIMAVFRPLIDLIASVAMALVIWYSTGLRDRGLVTLGIVIAFVQLIQKFFEPVKDIAEKFNILQSAMAGGERIFDMLDTVDRIPDGTRARSDETSAASGDSPASCDEAANASCGEIRFDNVHFSYVPGEAVLRGLDFIIKPGQTVAVVGATGAGKTTIANLITRLWDVDSGTVYLDGEDVRNKSLNELRKTVQPVQQDVFLFAGTIAENIDLGLGLSREAIVQAARLSRAEAFIEALPDKYDSLITEGASNLSAGQRQLIAFARIIAHDPRVIILDEATANVDTETEALLQQGLERLLNDRTALIIAHRLSTIRRADRILVLGHGKLIEEGTHNQLIEKKGVYHNLYKLQFAEGKVEEEIAI